MFEEEWYEAGLAAMEHYYAPAKLKEGELALLHAQFLGGAGEQQELLKLITAAFVGQLSDRLKGVAYETLGNALLQARRVKQAEAGLQRALEQYRKNQDLEGQARSLMHLGGCADPEQAIGFFQQALAAAEKAPNSQWLLGLIEFKIAQFYAAATDFENAAQRFDSSLQYLYPLGPTLTLAQVFLNSATLAFQTGNMAKAEELAHEGLRIAVFKHGWAIQGELLLLLSKMREGNTMASFERLNEAIFVLSKVPNSPRYLQTLVDRAFIWDANRQPTLAQQDAEQALEGARRLKNPELEGMAQLVLGKIYGRESTQIPKALEQLKLAKKNFESSQREEKLCDCELVLAEIEAQRGNSKEAKAHYEKALGLMENVLKQLAPGTQESRHLEMKKMHVESILQSLR